MSSLSKPRLLDLFCCAGGAGKGYADAGFEVIGIDINPQPNYPFEFYQEDAIHFLEQANLSSWDVIHASPPCQAFSQAVKKKNRDNYPNLIPITRDLLIKSNKPYIIENVPTAKKHLIDPIQLCGSAFGHPIRRHRLFESNLNLVGVECRHNDYPPKYPPAWNRTNLLRVISISGGYQRSGVTMEEKLEAMGVDWPMTLPELSESIPPYYSAYLGTQVLRELRKKVYQ